MNDLPMKMFNRDVVTINQELKRLEASTSPIIGLDSIKAWNETKAKVFSLLAKLRSFAFDMEIYESVAPTLYEFQRRVGHLPYVPDVRCITRAKNILDLHPRIIVTKDMRPDEQALPELKQVTVVSTDGIVLFDQDFLPQQVHLESLSEDSSSSEQPSTRREVSIAQMWDELIKVVSGHYVLAYELPLIQLQLEATADRFQLPVPVLIGESILDLYYEYLGIPEEYSFGAGKENSLISIDAIFDQLGEPFVRDTSYTTVEQATRIADILQGIANCTLQAPS